MKIFVVFTIISICFVNSEEEFGQRISKIVAKAPQTNSTNKESITSQKKDLDTHESIRTYEYALAPIEVQTHYPKVIAEEHTLHEFPALASSLKQALPMNEPIILTDNLGSTSKSLYGAQRMPKYYGSELPIYRDDPKDQLKGYLPRSLGPALPMHALSQIKPDTSDEEITIHAQPISIASAQKDPYASAPVKHIGLTGYSTNLNEHIRPHLENYGINKVELQELQGLHSIRSAYSRHSHLDYIPGIPGKPWKDYPIYSSAPYTNFKCQPHQPGFFADIEAGCQVWHYCQLDGRHDRFLCANGTLFNQKTRVCDWWYNVDCHSSVLKYGINADLYRVPTYKKYSETSYNPINKYETPSKHQISAPLNYHSIGPDLYHSGHGLVFAESQTVPQKQLIKRVRKVKSNNRSNSTELGLKNSKKAE